MPKNTISKSLASKKASLATGVAVVKYHRAVVRLVKRLESKCRLGHKVEPHTGQVQSLCEMYRMACTDLLAALAKMAR